MPNTRGSERRNMVCSSGTELVTRFARVFCCVRVPGRICRQGLYNQLSQKFWAAPQVWSRAFWGGAGLHRGSPAPPQTARLHPKIRLGSPAPQVGRRAPHVGRRAPHVGRRAPQVGSRAPLPAPPQNARLHPWGARLPPGEPGSPLGSRAPQVGSRAPPPRGSPAPPRGAGEPGSPSGSPRELGPRPRGRTGCAGFVHPSHPTSLQKHTFAHLWAR